MNALLEQTSEILCDPEPGGAGARRKRRASKISAAPSWRLDLRTGALIWSPSLYSVFHMPPSAAPPKARAALACMMSADRAGVRRAIFDAARSGIPTAASFRLSSNPEQVLLASTIPTSGTDGRPAILTGTVVRVDSDGSILRRLIADASGVASDAELRPLLRALCDLTGARTAAIWHGDSLRDTAFAPSSDFAPEDDELATVLPASPIGLDAVVEAASKGDLLTVADIASSPLLGGGDGACFRAWLEKAGAHAFAVIPIRRDQSLLAIVVLVFKSGETLGDPRVAIGIEAARAAMSAALTILESRRLVQQAVHDERSRLARDLHDTMSQGLCAALIHMACARSRIADDRDAALRALQLASDLTRSSLEEAHRCVWALRSTNLDDGGLEAAFARLISQMSSRASPPIKLSVVGPARRLTAGVEQCVWRIAQEALTNAVRHAEASEIAVELWFLSKRVALVVSDDGKGFDPADAQTGSGAGLIGLRERAAAIGATLTVDSTPGAGCVVRLETRPTLSTRGGPA